MGLKYVVYWENKLSTMMASSKVLVLEDDEEKDNHHQWSKQQFSYLRIHSDLRSKIFIKGLYNLWISNVLKAMLIVLPC